MKSRLPAIAALLLAVAAVALFWAWRSPSERRADPFSVSERQASPAVEAPAASLAVAPSVEPAPAIVPAVSGIVFLFESETPVAGAAVYARDSRNDSVASRAVTDDEGRFALEGLRFGVRYAVRVEPGAMGYTMVNDGSLTFEPGRDVEEMYIAVWEGLTIAGTVKDVTETYHPEHLHLLAGDFSTIKPEEFERAYGLTFRKADRPLPGVAVTLRGQGTVLAGVTDSEGRFAFPGVPRGDYRVALEAPEGAVRFAGDAGGYAQDVRAYSDPVRSVDFGIRFDGVTVSGTVTNEAGVPVADAAVSATPRLISADEGERVLSGAVETRTDGAGRYTLRGLMPADWRGATSFQRFGHLPSRGATYAIRVTAPGFAATEQWAPMITEAAIAVGTTISESLDNERRATDATGMYPRPDIALARTDGNRIEGIDFVLAAAGGIAGIAVDSRNEPVGGAQLQLSRQEEGPRAPRPYEARPADVEMVETAADGRFVFPSVPAGVYEATAWRRDRPSQKARSGPITVESGRFLADTTLVFESPGDWGGIEGRAVLAPSGRSVASFRVDVAGVESAMEPHPSLGIVSMDDETQGAFTVRDVSPGLVTVWVTAEGYPPVESSVRVESGRIARHRFEIAPGGVLEGKVTLNGRPMPGGVTAHRADGAGIPTHPGLRQDVVSGGIDEAGFFRLDLLPEGEYVVQAAPIAGPPPASVSRTGEARAFVAPGRVTTVTVDVEGGESITGVFTFPELFRSGRIHVLRGRHEGRTFKQDPRTYRELTAASSDSFRVSDAYTIPALPPGTYTLTAFCYNRRDDWDGDYQDDRPQLWRVVTVETGKPCRVDLTLSGD